LVHGFAPSFFPVISRHDVLLAQVEGALDLIHTLGEHVIR
jgi:hypothetical protein